MPFDPGAAVVAGFLATAIMTTALYAAIRLGMARTDLPTILGSFLLEPRSPQAWVLGMLVHFSVGLLFGLLYGAVFAWAGGGVVTGVGLGLGQALAVGLLLGLLCRSRPRRLAPGLAECPGFFSMRYSYPDMQGLFVLHAVFGLAMGILYPGLALPPR